MQKLFTLYSVSNFLIFSYKNIAEGGTRTLIHQMWVLLFNIKIYLILYYQFHSSGKFEIFNTDSHILFSKLSLF